MNVALTNRASAVNVAPSNRADRSGEDAAGEAEGERVAAGQVKAAVDASSGQVDGQLPVNQQVTEVIGTYLPVFTPSGGGFL